MRKGPSKAITVRQESLHGIQSRCFILNVFPPRPFVNCRRFEGWEGLDRFKLLLLLNHPCYAATNFFKRPWRSSNHELFASILLVDVLSTKMFFLWLIDEIALPVYISAPSALADSSRAFVMADIPFTGRISFPVKSSSKSL